MAFAPNRLRWLTAPLLEDLAEELSGDSRSGLRRRIETEADQEGLAPLEPRHWAVIRFVLDYYGRHQAAPLAVRIGRACGLGVRELHDLFPAGAARTALRLAGIALPTELPHHKSLSWWN